MILNLSKLFQHLIWVFVVIKMLTNIRQIQVTNKDSHVRMVLKSVTTTSKNLHITSNSNNTLNTLNSLLSNHTLQHNQELKSTKQTNTPKFTENLSIIKTKLLFNIKINLLCTIKTILLSNNINTNPIQIKCNKRFFILLYRTLELRWPRQQS